jgi:hypothetical protein
MIRDALVLFGSALAANYVAEKWVLKSSADDPNGFVLIAPGFGLDDAARAATFAVVAIIAHKLIPG